MSTIYIVILGLLLCLAVYDLVVGVSNDAANFLNSAVGSRAASRSVLFGVAAVGVLMGCAFSTGMMEIARKGVFMPAMFGFNDIMVLFLAVMLTDVILLDLFNTLGLPTSTTVSLVCELLGAAIAVALFVMGHDPAASQVLGDYINTDECFKMITGIFCSVLVAFTCGCVVMWFSRLLFSFRYKAAYKYIGALWCALALTAITYFAVFKGLKGSTLVNKEAIAYLNAHIGMATLIAFVVWCGLCSVLQYVFKVNSLKLAVLAGTGALALAFAGNDLVNFIGVFMAAKDSYFVAADYVAAGGDLATLKMGSLMAPVHVNVLWLLGAGVVMVLALVFSRKARTVIETEVKLARNNSVGKERFGSCLPARAAVRYTRKVVGAIARITPAPVARFVESRFRPLEAAEDDGTAFDLIRASVNLTVAALLISLATSMKLPLSTTYVTFMVAMGTSLADRAWGRDSAVYRITGVLVVIGGWFMTGIGAVTAAFVTASVMMYGGVWGIALMVAVAAFVLVKNALAYRNRDKHEVSLIDLNNRAAVQELGVASADRLADILRIYRGTVSALLAEDRDALKNMRRKARNICRALQAVKEDEILPTLQNIDPAHAPQAQILFRLHESTLSVAENLLVIVKNSYKHIDNNHAGLNEAQGADLLTMSDKVGCFFPEMGSLLRSGNYGQLDAVMAHASDLSDEFADCITRHLLRDSNDEGGMRNGILYLGLLNETRSMVRKAFSLIKEQKELLALYPQAD
ncbi:MAG: inorganic phosphate transporter [Akkermansia sp.]|nr:inorganic phosphate transporter [Akkermansia sp.]